MSNNSALEPFLKQLSDYTGNDDDFSFNQQFKDFLLRYYIGISDFRGEGPLVDCGLPHKIEKYLSLYGKVLAIELLQNKIFLGQLTGDLKKDFLNDTITKCDFTLIGDASQEKYQIRIAKKEEGGKKIKKLVVYGGDGKEDITIKPKRIVLFLNNEAGLPDQIGIDFWLDLLWDTLKNIKYDQKKCRKKMAVITRTKMDGTDKARAIEGFENSDYIFNISFDSSGTGKGKKMGIDPHDVNYSLSGPENSQERRQLWTDYREYIAEVCKFHGLVSQTSFKQERQNIPETMMLEAPYKAWEKERKQVRQEAYQKCQELGWIKEGWELNYGAQSETNQQKIQKLEEKLKIAELEEQIANIGKNKETKIEKKDEKEEKIIYDKKKI
ncbi:MAG: hypothetical protein I3273_04030 [Candidatus Moeniiplasma glomeromycotorum]|nr:hypothetical protein [Candidatus Moeniiplasma glomeromycotorum]